jgi:hypothetical protein
MVGNRRVMQIKTKRRTQFRMLHHHYLGSKHAAYLFVSSLVDGNRQLKDATRLATELAY